MKIANIEVKLIHHVGSDLDVVNAARVSFNKESEWEGWSDDPQLQEKDKKLINYLAKHKHHSPFNHSFLSFRVKAPLYVARQMVKHEYLPWNEVSRRYVDHELEYFQTEWRWAAENVKQGSSGSVAPDIQKEADEIFWSVAKHSCEAYDKLLSLGIAPEQARRVSLVDAATEWRWSGTLKAFLKMLSLRLDPHTQKETRIVAELIANEVRQLFPVSYAAYLEME